MNSADTVTSRGLTVRGIEAILAGQTVNLAGLPRDSAVELWRPPQFAPIFLVCYKRDGRIPTLREFWREYWTLRGAEAWAGITEMWPGDERGKLKALQGRLARAYPSLARDVHLCYLLSEGGLPAHHSLRNDRWGSDVTLTFPDGKVFIHCFVDTARSRYYRKEKDHRHAMTGRGRHLDLPLSVDDARIIGSFWLYGTVHVERVKAAITHA